jgi:HEAT repeat protein
MIIYSDASDDDKSLAINALIGIADDKYFPAFVEVLKASSSANLFRAAAIALSNISDKEKYFSVDFINYLKDLLYLENLSPKRKKDIIYLLGDASQFSNLAKNILTTASTDNNLDDYSRYFASQAISLSVDDLSPKQWQVFSLIN